MAPPGLPHEMRWKIARALKAGKGPTEISKQLGIGITTVARYARKFEKAGLLPSSPLLRKARAGRTRAEVRRLLLDGKSGRWIRMNIPGAGNIHALKREMIAAGELPPSQRPKALPPEKEAAIRTHLEQGKSIATIERLVECDWRTVRKRAVKLGYEIHLRGPVPIGVPPPLWNVSDATADLARSFYEAGYTDAPLGAELGLSRYAVARWRKRSGLSPLLPEERRQHFPTTRVEHEFIHPATLLSRVRAAVPRWMERDKAEEVVALMLADLVAGRLNSGAIEVAWRRYFSRVVRRYADRRSISLDEVIGDDGWTRGHALADPHALDELEQALERAWAARLN